MNDTHAENPHLLDTFLSLCRLPSPSHHEEPAAEYVRGFLEGLGLSWVEDDAAMTIPAGSGNIHVTLPANGVETGLGTPIFFCSHIDTVTLTDEVEPVVEDGIVRNARNAILGGDNKSAVAVMLELLRELATGEIPHAGVEVVFTPCEETGLLGAKAFDTGQLAARCGFVFDHAKPIGGVVAHAPSQLSYTATFTGRASHSGIAPEAGLSAIRCAARALLALPHGRVDDVSTANVGLIEGGTAVNVVPESCTLRGEVRSLDHDTAARMGETVTATLHRIAAEDGVDLDLAMHEEYRAYTFRSAAPVVQAAVHALEACGYAPMLIPCGGGSDANVFNAHGMPTVNMCNGMRDIHTSDESMAVADLHGMMRVARAIVDYARNMSVDQSSAGEPLAAVDAGDASSTLFD